MQFALVFTRTDKWLISTKVVDWRVWQDKLYWYMTSLDFASAERLAKYLVMDYVLPEAALGHILSSISGSENMTYELEISTDKQVTITPVKFDLFEVDGQVIDWRDSKFIFMKKGAKYELLKFGETGVDLEDRIELSADEVKLWETMREEFVIQLAAKYFSGIG